MFFCQFELQKHLTSTIISITNVSICTITSVGSIVILTESIFMTIVFSVVSTLIDIWIQSDDENSHFVFDFSSYNHTYFIFFFIHSVSMFPRRYLLCQYCHTTTITRFPYAVFFSLAYPLYEYSYIMLCISFISYYQNLWNFQIITEHTSTNESISFVSFLAAAVMMPVVVFAICIFAAVMTFGAITFIDV